MVTTDSKWVDSFCSKHHLSLKRFTPPYKGQIAFWACPICLSDFRLHVHREMRRYECGHYHVSHRAGLFEGLLGKYDKPHVLHFKPNLPS